MSTTRVGVILDDFGRPMRSISRDDGPSHAYTTTSGFHGSMVVGAHGRIEQNRQHANRVRPERTVER